jgi:nucleoside-diphosphate-sugar epimerase
MNDKKVVAVTGANGYIGRHVVDALIDQGAEVIAVDLVLEGINSQANQLKMDIFSDFDHIYSRLGSPDICLHLAWKDGFLHNSDAHMEGLSGHYEFIRSLKNSGIKQVAVMGTMHEIGYHEGVIDENTPCNPINMYGIAKDALRKSLLLMAQQTGLIVQWLRAFYIYGDDEKNHSIFTKILQAEKKGQLSFPLNSGKNKYDFIHIEDLARMIAACVLQNELAGIINCCTGQPVSLAEKVESFLIDQNLKIRPEYGAFPDRPYDSPAIWGDSARIVQIMNRIGQR